MGKLNLKGRAVEGKREKKKEYSNGTA